MKLPGWLSDPQSPARLIVVLASSIFVVELSIHFLLEKVPPIHPLLAPVVDAASLVSLLVPILLVGVFHPMVRHIKEREQADVSMRAAHELLEHRVQARTAELEQRNREMGLLAEMTDFLQACSSADEAYRVIASTAEQLLKETAGTLYIFSASRNDLEARSSWGGDAASQEKVFLPDECWALRRGRAYPPSGQESLLICQHVPREVSDHYRCVPMIAQGEVLGVLHLRGLTPDAPGMDERRAMTLIEHVSLALMNLKLRETLHNQSIRDPLTGLFNRRYMEETLERELLRARRSESPLTVAMLDLDFFKTFNDTHGHEAGDLLLREVGALLKANVRGSDIACRYGGEELTLILPDTNIDQAYQRLDSVRRAIKRLDLRHRGQPLGFVTTSIGVAVFPEHGTAGDSLVHTADRALYRAKEEGRDRVVLADLPRTAQEAPQPVVLRAA